MQIHVIWNEYNEVYQLVRGQLGFVKIEAFQGAQGWSTIFKA